MSLGFQQIIRQNNGILVLNVGTGAPIDPVPSQGLLVDEDGAIYASNDTSPDHWANGLPFDVNGRLVVEESLPVIFDQGLPFSASGAVAVTENTGIGGHYNQGVRFESNGALAVEGLAPPLVDSNVLALSYRSASGGMEFYRTDLTPWALVDLIPDFTPASVWKIAWSEQANQLAIGYDTFDAPGGFDVYDTSVVPFNFIAHVDGAVGIRVTALAFNPAGTRLGVIMDAEAGVRARTYATNDYSGPFWVAENGYAQDIAYNYDGSRFVICAELFISNFLRIYETVTGTIVPNPAGIPTDVAFSHVAANPSRNVIALYQNPNGPIWICDLDTDTTIGSIAVPNGPASALEWSNDGSLLSLGRSGSGEQVLVFTLPDIDDPLTWGTVALSPGVTGSGGPDFTAWSDSDAYLAAPDDAEPVADRVRAYSTAAIPYTPITSFNVISAVPGDGVFLSNISLPAI